MAAASHMKLEGGRELEQALMELDGRIARKIASKALRAGAKVVAKEVKAEAPQESGATKKAVKVRAGKNRKNRRTIRVAIGEQWFVGDQFYAAFLEFGHRQGSRKLGDARKEIPGRHFMQDAWEATKEQALNTVMTTARALVDEEAAKIGRSIGGVK